MSEIYQNIDKYYSDKVSAHGASPKGVDWNDEATQLLRFDQLIQVIRKENSVLGDLGCGYGKLYEHMLTKYDDMDYVGFDLSYNMIEQAASCYPERRGVYFRHIQDMESVEEVDYMVASGIFNVKMNHSPTEWQSYITDTINLMNDKSRLGFSFNMLTKYSDKEYMREDLFYADPMFFFDYCKQKFSLNVALLHDYGLYEFTLVVRKDVGK